jgi:hypothetical protein
LETFCSKHPGHFLWRHCPAAPDVFLLSFRLPGLGVHSGFPEIYLLAGTISMSGIIRVGSPISHLSTSITKLARGPGYLRMMMGNQLCSHSTAQLLLLACGGSEPTTSTSMEARQSQPTQSFSSFIPSLY